MDRGFEKFEKYDANKNKNPTKQSGNNIINNQNKNENESKKGESKLDSK